jgi:low temperature requirement protein LtrA
MISLHYQHLLERHGLFVIIVLGECLVALSTTGTLVFGALALSILFALWWIYFDWKYDPVDLKSTGQAFAFNYGHLVVYASLGLVAGGISHGSDARLMVAGVALFLAALAVMNWLSGRDRGALTRRAELLAAAVLLASIAVPDAGRIARAAFAVVALVTVIVFNRNLKYAQW